MKLFFMLSGCSVCFWGSANEPQTIAIRLALLTLLGILIFVLVSFGIFF